jgi:hypothetical protein
VTKRRMEFIDTKSGDVLIHHKKAAQSIYVVCIVFDDGDQEGQDCEPVVGRKAAEELAKKRRGPNGRMYHRFNEDEYIEFT